MADAVHADVRLVAHHVPARVVVGNAPSVFTVLSKRASKSLTVWLIGHAKTILAVLFAGTLDILAWVNSI